MRMPNPVSSPLNVSYLSGIGVQRQVETTNGEVLIQQKRGIANDMAATNEDPANGLKLDSGGSPLPEPMLRFFEPRFGCDFGHVRLHTSQQASQLADRFNADAFTIENHIYFGSNSYRPQTRQGKALIAHELTHVIQQNYAGTGFIQRSIGSPAGGCGICYGSPRYAGTAAHQVVEAAFVDLYSPLIIHSEQQLRPSTGDDNGRLDLSLVTGNRIGIGEIKPANPAGLLQGDIDILDYEDQLIGLGFDVGRLNLPPPVGGIPFTDPSARNCNAQQMLYVEPPIHGIYQYWCEPDYKVLKPQCDCEDDSDDDPIEVPIPVPVEQPQEQDERDREEVDDPNEVLVPALAATAVTYAFKNAPRIGQFLAQWIGTGGPALATAGGPGTVLHALPGGSATSTSATQAARSALGTTASSTSSGGASAARAVTTGGGSTGGGSAARALMGRLGIAGIAAAITYVMFTETAKYTYGTIYEGTRGWKLKEALKNIALTANQANVDARVIERLSSNLVEVEMTGVVVPEREQIFEAMKKLNQSLYLAGHALGEGARSYSAIAEQIDFSSEAWILRQFAESIRTHIGLGSKHYDPYHLHLALNTHLTWLNQQVQKLADHYGEIISQDQSNWLARRR
jgi:hypothetical protein